MTWEGAVPRSQVSEPLMSSGLRPLHQVAIDFLTNTDLFLAQNQSPDAPSWTRAFTDLPEATVGERYTRILREGVDYYDLNNDIVEIRAERDGFFSNVPSWLIVFRDNAGRWRLSGDPTNPSAEVNEFKLVVTNNRGETASRKVVLRVNGADGDFEFGPITPE